MRAIKLMIFLILVLPLSIYAQSEFQIQTRDAYTEVYSELNEKLKDIKVLVDVDDRFLYISIEQKADVVFPRNYTFDIYGESVSASKGFSYDLVNLIYNTKEERGVFKNNNFSAIRFEFKYVDKLYNIRTVKFVITTFDLYELGYPFFESSFINLIVPEI